MTESDVQKVFWQVFLAVVSPLYIALLGLLVKWWTERPTREYERETKRLQFFKAFYDLYSLEKPNVGPTFDARCQQLLRDTSRWMNSRRTKGIRLAKFLSVCTGVVSALYVQVYSAAQLPIPSVPQQPALFRSENQMLFLFVVPAVAGSVVYRLVLPIFERIVGFLATFERFQYLGDAEW
jgi:hypothetical protein